MRYFNHKKLSLTLSAALAAAWIPLTPATSFAVTVGDFDYSIAGKTATLDGCKNDTCPGNLVIPAKVPGTTIPVTSIGENAFRGYQEARTFITVTLPSSITSIERNAFADVSISNPLVLPANLTRIEDNAFSGSSLSTITFNKALTYIGNSAFSEATIQVNPTLEMQAGEIRYSAFSGISFDSVTLGPNFSMVANGAFAKPLNSIVTPEIETLSIAGGDIGNAAFAGTKIDSITLGSKIGMIKSGAFGGYSGDNPTLSGDLIVNAGVIESGAFSNSSFLSINIGKAVSVVGSGAFGSSSSPSYPSLGNVSVNAPVISSGAFSNATMLSLTIGTNVGAVDSGAFGGNSGGPFALGDILIKGGTFSASAFTGIEARKTTINSTVKKIGASAFSNGNKLGDLSINMQKISESAFFDSEATSLSFGTNVKAIGEEAFAQFTITGQSKAISINVPDIGKNAFYRSNITGLTLGSKVQTIENSAFADIPSLSNVTVNSGQIKAYAFSQSGVDNLVIGSGVTSIGKYAFADTSIDSLDIANGVTSIGEYAFMFTSGTLTAVRIPNSVVFIGEYALSFPQLRSISLGTGLRYLEQGAFYDNSELANVEFYGPPPTGSSAFPNQIMNVHHTAAHDTAWAAAFAANQQSWMQISKVSGLPQPTFTSATATATPSTRKIAIRAAYSMGSTGKVKLTVTQSGSKTVLCTTTVQTRNPSGVSGFATCDLSKKIRDGLKKEALKLNVTVAYSPDLGDTKSISKTLTLSKQ